VSLLKQPTQHRFGVSKEILKVIPTNLHVFPLFDVSLEAASVMFKRRLLRKCDGVRQKYGRTDVFSNFVWDCRSFTFVVDIVVCLIKVTAFRFFWTASWLWLEDESPMGIMAMA
jgi:hypothetical protein